MPINDMSSIVGLATSSIPAERAALKRSTRAVAAPTNPVWSRAEQFDRLGAAYEFIHAKGGKAFTLRLATDDLIQVTGSADPVRTMARRLQRAFARASIPMPPVAFSLEVTPDERNQLHLHGALVLGDLLPSEVQDILRDAAGHIDGRAGSRQVKLTDFDLARGGPLGWAYYTKRGAARTRRQLGQQRITYISGDIRRLVGVDWDMRRGQLINRPKRMH
jgi:hypothetical protein